MRKDSIKEVLSLAKKDKVSFIDLQFSDFLGNIKSSTIPVYNLKDALERGVWFDGSSVEGFARIHESDMYLMPDPQTYALIPWRNHLEGGRVARLICDVYKPNHEPFEGDPRNILKRALEEARKLGFEYFTGPECEFFLFPKTLVDMHPAAVDAKKRFGHESGVEIMFESDEFRRHFQSNRIIRRFQSLVITDINFVLTVSHLMSTGFDGNPHFPESFHYFPFDSVRFIHD